MTHGEPPLPAVVKMPAARNRKLPTCDGVTPRRDLAGRRGDTEPPQSRARLSAEAASADVGCCSSCSFCGANSLGADRCSSEPFRRGGEGGLSAFAGDRKMRFGADAQTRRNCTKFAHHLRQSRWVREPFYSLYCRCNEVETQAEPRKGHFWRVSRPTGI